MTASTQTQDVDEALLDHLTGGSRLLVGAEMQNVVYSATSTSTSTGLGLDENIKIKIKIKIRNQESS